MPIIKITQTSKGSNKGSCSTLEKYLQKENKDKDFSEHTNWYCQDRDYVPRGEVVHRIDSNHKGLGKEDAKFFMLTINYSEKEINFIDQKFGSNEMQIAEFKMKFTRQVMDIYANNFGKGIKGNDLVYFAVNEQNRYFKGNDSLVRTGHVKQMEAKTGENDHTHIIISRRDKGQRYKLSPLTNHIDTKKGKVKGGFNRVQFKLDCEVQFDKELNYVRDFEDKAEVLIKRAKGELMIKPNLLAIQEKDLHLENVPKEMLEKIISEKKQKSNGLTK